MTYKQAVALADELKGNGLLFMGAAPVLKNPGAAKQTPEERRAKQRIAMRIKRHGADVVLVKQWPELAGLTGKARETAREKLRRQDPAYRAREAGWAKARRDANLEAERVKGAVRQAAWRRRNPEEAKRRVAGCMKKSRGKSLPVAEGKAKFSK